MPITIGSNIASLQAQRRLNESSDSLSRVYERLGSGMRINHASDDAAGLAIADSLRASSRIFAKGIRNLNDGLSMLSIAEGAVRELTGVVTRVAELSEQAANGIYSPAQRRALDAEAQSLGAEYNRILATTTYNDIEILSGELVTLQGGFSTISFTLGGGLAQRTVGTGELAPGVFYDGGADPNAIFAYDFNNDGVDDIATGNNNGANALTVFIANGDGSFLSARGYAGSGNANGITGGDFNSDGVLDLAISVDSSATFSVYFGNSDGTFDAGVQIAAGNTNRYGIDSGDFNGDGKIDFVLGSLGSTVYSVVMGNGDGTFLAAVTYSIGTSSRSPTVADFNNDNIADYVSVNGGTTARVFLGVGDGTFGAPIALVSAGSGFGYSESADVNNDGNEDIVLADNTTGALVLFLGNGDGTFGARRSYASGAAVLHNVATTDINGDGFLDVFAASSAGDEVFTFLGNGDGSFRAPLSAAVGANADLIALGDFNGDSVLDAAVTPFNEADGISVLLSESVRIGGFPAINLLSRGNAASAIDRMVEVLNGISAELSNIGSLQSRLGTFIESLKSSEIGYQTAESRIRDLDIAQESARLIHQKILQQAGASVLAQASQQPSLALRLLNG